ncbi:diaminopimelate epimerase [Akkermansiaceae bacterium]|nr:diaminopimelate epimerase [Akkermansiaceae bacterium]
MLLHFYKMNGAGNDFVVIDNRSLKISLSKDLIAGLCDRHRGIGADGLLAVEPAEKGADYKFRYYNADGGEAEMCGNGARCFGRFTAHLSGEVKNMVSFETIAGTLTAEMIGDSVKIAMSDPFDLDLDTSCKVDDISVVDFLNTGVPHAVSFIDDLASADIKKLGATVRYHERFAPNGTNANFYRVVSQSHIAIRTYERGVEDETLACGTGMCASALIHHLKTGDASPIKVDVAGGDTLEIGFEKDGDSFKNVTLSGPADFVFEGDIEI